MTTQRTRPSVNRGHLTSVFSGQLPSALTRLAMTPGVDLYTGQRVGQAVVQRYAHRSSDYVRATVRAHGPDSIPG
jgi:hypothetical protein